MLSGQLCPVFGASPPDSSSRVLLIENGHVRPFPYRFTAPPLPKKQGLFGVPVLRLRSPCYVVTFVKRESAIYFTTILFFREHLKRVLEKQLSALATLLFVDWLPQVNGPPKSPVSLKS